MDAYYAMKALSENPEKFGPFFRKLIPKVDEDLEPKVPVNSMSAVFLSCGLTGTYDLDLFQYLTCHTVGQSNQECKETSR